MISPNTINSWNKWFNAKDQYPLWCDAKRGIGIKENKASKKLVEGNIEFPGLANVPPHLDLDKPKLTGKINGKCDREWVALEINELLVVEYYSRKV